MDRCSWANRSQLELDYHDQEWGRPCYDNDYLFEMLVLEIMQAGLSWTTIMDKREHLRSAFDHFDPRMIQNYNKDKVDMLMKNDKIIRHRLKIEAIIHNAEVFMSMDDFSSYCWSFVDYKPMNYKRKRMSEVPSQSELSKEMSLAMKKKGFKFVGPTTIYAFMQAIGMVNDHLVTCPIYQEIKDGLCD